MTRSECKELLKKDILFSKLYFKNYYEARKSFSGLIEQMEISRPGVKIVLHHLNPKCNNYEEWFEVIPMWTDTHSSLHHKGKGKFGVPKDHPDYIKLRYRHNAEHYRQKKNEYYDGNKDSINEKRRAEYELNKEEINQQKRNWYSSLPDEKKETIREKAKLKIAKRKENETPEQREERLSRDRLSAKRIREKNKDKRNACERERRKRKLANETLEERAVRLTKRKEYRLKVKMAG